MASRLETLPDDILLEIVSHLSVRSILKLRMTSRRLQQVTLLRVAWIRAYSSSMVPRLDPPADPDKAADFNYEKHLIRATRLDANWTSPFPSPSRVQVLHDTPASAAWLFRSRFLITVASSQILCWDLGLPSHNGNPTVAWGETLRGRSPVIEAAVAQLGDSEGLLVAYTSEYPIGCLLIYSSFKEDGSCSSPKGLPFLDTPHPVKAIGMNGSELALVCSDGTLIVHDISTQKRRSISLIEETVPIWIHTIRTFEDFVLIARYRNRSVVLEVYHLAESESDPSIITNQPGFVQLPHAQTTSISGYKQSRSILDGVQTHTFQILASFSDCIKLYQLSITSQGLDNIPHIKLRCLCDDLPTTSGPSRDLPSRDEAEEISNADAYDSDSTSNRISHPLQVMDMALGASGNRAVVIPISSRTNDRTIWGYSVLESGNLLRRPWPFLERKDGPPAIPVGALDSENEHYGDLLRRHACRALFDEVSGKVIIAADCQMIVIFDFGVIEE